MSGSDIFLALLNVVVFGGIALWYIYRIRLPNTVTVEFNRLTRAIVYDIYSGARWVLKPGTYSLPVHHKVTEVVDTNIQQVRGENNDGVKKTFRVGEVEFVFVYEYGFWYVRDATGAAESQDEALSTSVLQAYERYDKTDQRYGAVQQRISQAIERIGRSFRAKHIANATKNPCDVQFVDGLIEEVVDVVRVGGNLPPLRNPQISFVAPAEPDWNGWARVDDDSKLLILLTKYVKHVVNEEIREFGMELTEFFVKEIPYKRSELQARGEKEYETERLLAAVDKLIAAGRAGTPQEAMLIALGQDDKYANLVAQTKWQKLIRQTVRNTVGKVTVTDVERVIVALEQAIRGPRNP